MKGCTFDTLSLNGKISVLKTQNTQSLALNSWDGSLRANDMNLLPKMHTTMSHPREDGEGNSGDQHDPNTLGG